ncbi:SDR family NAD(P)-dependent oxidoreductase [Microtetraspora sp. NBRC 16547]|uniref:SDR family NAD(P)-dependent oxidoreductase n=1 Tax=Microtetraspora sp. NBRC 16547 TaxID=3030993 RepID=UPI0024A15354|nr:SDR family NAD(P)-dependent oxidoreductase [Microtetraspora sp. NBRC 16547]GLX02524.1 oxidoreductase [Microtetraspora sp. NBRC 16547]
MDREGAAALLRLIGEARDLPLGDPDRLRIEHAALALVRDGQRRRRRERRRDAAAADASVLAATAMGAVDRVIDAPVGPGPGADAGPDAGGRLRRTRRCYICKSGFVHVDGFYHLLCPSCAALNRARRTARADLSGRRALVTGGRTKIGHHVALKMLGDGAHVTVTTRFPRDAARRFAEAGDRADWADRLRIVGIDLRDPRQVIALTDHLLEGGDPLDILINNAAQTLRRPPSAYAALLEGERLGLPAGAWSAPGFSPVRAGALPGGEPVPLDGDPHLPDVSGLLPDLSAGNSWSARIGEIDAAEVLEVQLVNAVAPFLLIDRLLPLLRATRSPRRYVVNVSAVEGQFTVANKTGRHPHTNMAKAGLNMLTRTSAADLAKQGIYLCSVDTGWITDENPLPTRERLNRRTPLDVIDGAARVYDPIVRGESGDPVHGVFLKDYAESPW